VHERQDPSVTPAVPFGLLLARAVHDLEEVLTFERWKRTAVPRLRARFPRVPGLVWQRLESASAQDFALAVAIVGVLMATASAAGQASSGRSRYFQLMLAGFRLHTVSHVASAMAARGYTPGMVTAPLVAAPFAAWAVRQLKTAGSWEKLSARDIVPGTALALAVFGHQYGWQDRARLVSRRDVGCAHKQPELAALACSTPTQPAMARSRFSPQPDCGNPRGPVRPLRGRTRAYCAGSGATPTGSARN
jgi:hypothetical protein